jgi:ApaG protein
MSICITQGIRISVNTRYLSDESDPDQSKYIFAYEVTIENEGEAPAQLLTRHWIIKDAENNVEEVRGDGVIGQMPYLDPGQAFTYTSFCPLRSKFGVMRGSYGMVRPDGETFEAEIAPFALLPQFMLN